MAFTKKTWKDRITEFPTRRTLTKSDGSTEIVTVARAEGTVSQEGDAFNAASMNDLEDRIAQANNDLNESLSGIDIRVNAETGKPEWSPRGADTWSPFNNLSGIIAERVVIWSGSTGNVTLPSGYLGFIAVSMCGEYNDSNANNICAYISATGSEYLWNNVNVVRCWQDTWSKTSVAYIPGSATSTNIWGHGFISSFIVGLRIADN